MYVISEIDKERKNTPELSEVKRNTDECNQKNDLFGVLLENVASCLRYCKPRVRESACRFATPRKPRRGRARTRRMGDDMRAKRNFARAAVFSPFHFFALLYDWVFGKFTNLYVQYRYIRADNTLSMYLLKSITAAMQRHYTAVCNTFGCGCAVFGVESGR